MGVPTAVVATAFAAEHGGCGRDVASLEGHLRVPAGAPGCRGSDRGRNDPGMAPFQLHQRPPRGVKVRATHHGRDPAYRRSIYVANTDVDQLSFALNLHRHSALISYYCHVGAYTYYDVVTGRARRTRAVDESADG